MKDPEQVMKGIVFTEFMELVEEKFGLEMVDTIIQQSDLPSGGIYTAVGTYDHTEVLSLVTSLSQQANVPIGDLVFAFGRHLFKAFTKGYGELFQGIHSSADFLSKVESFIHVEVKKLYPDAMLPSIHYAELDAKSFEVRYESSRPFADLAAGLIHECVQHFGENLEIERDKSIDSSGTAARFVLRQVA